MKRALKKLFRTTIVTMTIVALVGGNTAIVLAQTSNFNPATTQGTSSANTFGGRQFTSVGGAVAGCLNIGNAVSSAAKSISGGLSSLFSSKPSTAPGSAAATTVSSGTGATSVGSAPTSVPYTNPSLKSVLQGQVSANGSPIPVDDNKVYKLVSSTDQNIAKMTRITQCENAIAYAASKFVLQQVSNKWMNFINTGLNGKPIFVQNVPSYLRNVRDQELSRYLSGLDNSDNIFAYPIRSVITQQVTGRSDGLIDKIANTPEGVKYQGYMNNFSSGGWDMLLDNHYNPLSAIFNATDELSNNINSAQQDKIDQITRGKGFLDLTRCVEWANGGRVNSTRVPGGALDQDPQCLREETVTPGSVIADQASLLTTSSIRQLENADQINEVLGSFFDQFLNNLFSKGISGLGNSYGTGATLESLGLGGGGISNSQPGSQTGSGSSIGYLSTASNDGVTIDFDISRPQQLRTILQTQYDFRNKSLDSQAVLDRIVPTLGSLDYCIPGPNPDWQNGLNDNLQIFLSSVGGATETAANGSGIGSAVGAIGGSFIPGIGTAVGAAIGNLVGGLIGGLFGGGKTTTYAAQPSLYDKTIDQNLTISQLVYIFKSEVPLGEFLNPMKDNYNSMLSLFNSWYSPTAIRNAFVATVSTPSDKVYADGFVTDSLNETTKLSMYSVAVRELDTIYADQKTETQDAIDELESIRGEVSDIVTTAKARYIKEQAAAGAPVDKTCIDSAYVIDTSPIVGVPTVESPTPDPNILKSDESRIYFYSHL